MDFISNSSEETQKLAQNILKQIKNKNIIALYGELGSGKTTFVQGLAKTLGIKKRILSPTFVLVREYKIPKFSISNFQFSILFHIDCYRIESEKDLKSIDLFELWSDPKDLVVIEWADRLRNILPSERIDIKFEYIDETKRKITINNC